jgi:hypothetical protein
MPVFYYLSRDEAADVYLYLVSFPPQQQQRFAMTATAVTPQNSPGSGDTIPPPVLSPMAGAEPLNVKAVKATGIPDWLVTLCLIGVGGAAIGLIVVALGFAAYELRRLGNAGEVRQQRGRTYKGADFAVR